MEPDGFEIPLRNLRAEAEIFRPENLPLLTEEMKLSAEYDQIIGAQTVDWEGQELTVTQLRPVYQDHDRAVRERAWRLAAERQLADREAINDLWSKLLPLRIQAGAQCRPVRVTGITAGSSCCASTTPRRTARASTGRSSRWRCRPPGGCTSSAGSSWGWKRCARGIWKSTRWAARRCSPSPTSASWKTACRPSSAGWTRSWAIISPSCAGKACWTWKTARAKRPAVTAPSFVASSARLFS